MVPLRPARGVIEGGIEIAADARHAVVPVPQLTGKVVRWVGGRRDAGYIRSERRIILDVRIDIDYGPSNQRVQRVIEIRVVLVAAVRHLVRLPVVVGQRTQRGPASRASRRRSQIVNLVSQNGCAGAIDSVNVLVSDDGGAVRFCRQQVGMESNQGAGVIVGIN